ncbi:hypothetical protein SNE40_008199 [Patella caerulea]|uniref:Uncharacterized protein n=1 Tax=Patella caerulea TaxID=87958 RepID=A0AAN8JZA1_PATCE
MVKKIVLLPTLVVVFICTKVYSAGRIYDICSSQGDCPDHSTCKPNGCKGYNCLCSNNKAADDMMKTCQAASSIGSFCDNTTKCLSRKAECSGNTCVCNDFFRTSDVGSCTFKDLRDLGENCTSSRQCSHATTVCNGGVCECASGYRLKTADEYWVDPLETEQCVLTNYSLEFCGSERLATPAGISAASVYLQDSVSGELVTESAESAGSVAGITSWSFKLIQSSSDFDYSVINTAEYPHPSLTEISPDIRDTEIIRSSIGSVSVNIVGNQEESEMHSATNNQRQVEPESRYTYLKSSTAPSKSVEMLTSRVQSLEEESVRTVVPTVVTAEEIRIIIGLLGACVGTVFILFLTVLISHLCKCQRHPSNSVSPEPTVQPSTLPTIKRQLDRFEDRW